MVNGLSCMNCHQHGMNHFQDQVRDSNILRRTTGDNHELVSRLGLGGRWDQRVVGRQSVHLEGRLDGYVYDRFSDLDNIAYAGLGEWRFEVGNDLAGTVGVSRRKFQASLSEIQRATHDPITETVVNTGARYALLRGRTAIRLAAGEMVRGMHEARDLIIRGGVDVVQPDAVLTGGIGGCRRIAMLADLCGPKIRVGTFEGGAIDRRMLGIPANGPFPRSRPAPHQRHDVMAQGA